MPDAKYEFQVRFREQGCGDEPERPWHHPRQRHHRHQYRRGDADDDGDYDDDATPMSLRQQIHFPSGSLPCHRGSSAQSQHNTSHPARGKHAGGNAIDENRLGCVIPAKQGVSQKLKTETNLRRIMNG